LHILQRQLPAEHIPRWKVWYILLLAVIYTLVGRTSFMSNAIGLVAVLLLGGAGAVYALFGESTWQIDHVGTVVVRRW